MIATKEAQTVFVPHTSAPTSGAPEYVSLQTQSLRRLSWRGLEHNTLGTGSDIKQPALPWAQSSSALLLGYQLQNFVLIPWPWLRSESLTPSQAKRGRGKDKEW